MYYTVYKTTNLVNGKIYIGCHKTTDLNDDYIGSGTILRRAVAKYGIENFSKEFIAIFNNSEDMFNMEAYIVTEDFVSEQSNYNLKVGGEGGFDYINKNKLNKGTGGLKLRWIQKKGREKQKWLFENDPVWQKQYSKKRSKIAKANKEFHGHMKGKSHSEETKQKMSDTKKGTGIGSNNSQHGTCWIHSLTAKQSIKIKKSELNSYLKKGWIKGRKMKFLDL